jgi:outer membrane receptor protein involved in Fe transport
MAVFAGILAGVLPASNAAAQAVNPPATSAGQETTGETIKLSPFEVRADSDNSYGALQSNSLTSFSLDLAKTPVTAQIFTEALMNDLAVSSVEDMLVNYHGSVSGATHNSTDAMTQEPGDRSGGSGLSIRGINISDMARDGFVGPPPNVRSSTGTSTNYQIERVEVIEGPQSILYGASSGGGVVNTISKRANFNQHKGSLRSVVDNNGTIQGLIDYNYGNDKFAVRLAGLAAENRTVRDRVGNDMRGIYTQLAFQLTPSTVVRLQTEWTDAMAFVSHNPNLNVFMASSDPRRGKDARYLALTNQLGDLNVLDGGLDYYNLNGLGSWWSSERITTQFSSLSLDSKLGRGFSVQIKAVHNDTLNLRATDGRTLLPAKGRPNAAANPYEVTAMRIGSPVQINEQRDRIKGLRIAFAHEAEINLWGNRGRSQTAFGAHGHERGPRFASSGIAKAYYRVDENGNNVINPNVALDYGRERLQFVYFPVQGGVPKTPLFRPGTEHVTVNGVNYVLQQRIEKDPALVTAENPYGLIPNNPTAANPNQYSGNFHRGAFTESYTIYGANFSDWLEGRLSTLVGFSLTQFEAVSVKAGETTGVTEKQTTPAWQAGVSYAVRPWMRAYVGMGQSEQPENATLSLFGKTLRYQSTDGLSPDIGLKIHTPDDRYSMQLNYNPSTTLRDERRNTGDVNALNTVNPDGINGRHGGEGAQNRVNVDRSLEGASLTLTANPTQNLRLRANLTYVDGEILSTVREAVVYNDQFHTSGQNVTYADGANVLIDPTGGNNRTVPLTLGMLNDPDSPWYADPEPNSGAIDNGDLQDVLTEVHPLHGQAATGVTGLPISDVQYNYTSPYPDGVYTIYAEGDKNTGFNQYSFNLQSKYTFSSGRLKGLGVFGDVRTYFQNRAYYVFDSDTQTRSLYRIPRTTIFNAGVHYSFRIRDRYVWTTQLNVRNLFDDYKVVVMPEADDRESLLARLSAQPREWVWTNSISF